MRHALSILVFALVGLSGTTGCGVLNDGPQQAVCEGRVECTIRLGAYVNEERPLKPGEVLFVRGNCEQTDGVAIRVVSFAGQRMENPGFNYEQWEVEFGYAFVTTYDTGEGWNVRENMIKTIDRQQTDIENVPDDLKQYASFYEGA